MDIQNLFDRIQKWKDTINNTPYEARGKKPPVKKPSPEEEALKKAKENIKFGPLYKS